MEKTELSVLFNRKKSYWAIRNEIINKISLSSVTCSRKLDKAAIFYS